MIKENFFDDVIAASELETDHRWKKWAKWIDSVDESISNGYMYVGEFIPLGTVDLDVSRERLILVAATTGSNRYRTVNYTVVKMHAGGDLELLEEIETDDQERGWALRLRDPIIAELAKLSGEQVNELAELSDDQLIAELERRGYSVTAV